MVRDIVRKVPAFPTIAKLNAMGFVVQSTSDFKLSLSTGGTDLSLKLFLISIPKIGKASDFVSKYQTAAEPFPFVIGYPVAYKKIIFFGEDVAVTPADLDAARKGASSRTSTCKELYLSALKLVLGIPRN
jgi:hypothetical protein